MARRRRKRAHGLGCVYQRGPKNFWIKWREGSQIRYAHGYGTRELAEEVLGTILANLTRGQVGLKVDSKEAPTLGDLAIDWLDRRQETHRSAGDDKGRWNRHLRPWLGKLRPDDVDPALLRRIIEAKLGEKLSSSTARLLMRLLSTFYSDLVERGIASKNPVKALPRATRRLIRPAHDPRTTPFLETVDDIRRVFLALPEPLNVAFAVGALGGLRTGEILALRWENVDLETRRIHVRESTGGPLNDDDSRVVPILDALHPLLKGWKVRTGGVGQVVPTMRKGGKRCDAHTVGVNLKDTLEALKMPAVSWYQATRHTFASHWVMAGGSIEKLREVLGHSSVVVTERYAHLRTDLFGQADLSRVVVDLSAATGKILPLPAVTQAAGEGGAGAVGYAGVTIDEGGNAGGTVSQQDHSSAGVAKWYTQRTQNPPLARAYEFKSRLRHQQNHGGVHVLRNPPPAFAKGKRVPNGYWCFFGAVAFGPAQSKMIILQSAEQSLAPLPFRAPSSHCSPRSLSTIPSPQ